jgi:Skp family chaperone for outer membrane proteins
MGIPATKIEFEKELQRRRKEYSQLQAKLDIEELNRRVADVEEGRSKLLSEKESEALLRELGYYD